MYIYTYFLYMYVSAPEDRLFDFREKGRERERERHIIVREKHLLVASRTRPNGMGRKPHPRHVL